MHEELNKLGVERLGRAGLITELEKAGVLCAFPERDRGIDLIAYSNAGSFEAVPLQLKASSGRGFYTNRKYLKIAGLRIVYLWNIGTSERIEAFCMNYPLAEAIVDQQQRSRKDGVYFTQAGARLLECLEPQRVRNWRLSLFGKS